MRVLVIGAALVALAGCVEPEPLPPREPIRPPATRAEACGRLYDNLSNPYVSPMQQQATLELMRNAGCMGG